MKHCKGCTMEPPRTQRHGAAPVTRVSCGTLARTRGRLGTCYAGVCWNDVGNLRVVGTCNPSVSWSVVEHRVRLARVTRMSFHASAEKSAWYDKWDSRHTKHRTQWTSWRNRFLHHCSVHRAQADVQTQELDSCEPERDRLTSAKQHEASSDGDNQTPLQWWVTAHLSIVLHVLNNAAFCGKRNCDHRQSSHRSIHTD